MVNRDELLRRLLQRYPITVFAPTNEAINRNKEWVLGRENSVVSYHILTLFANKSSFPFVYTTSLPGSPPLYGGVKRYPGSRKVEYFANNAKIIDSKEYTSTEGENQILYVIDDILEPYVSSTSMPPSAYDLLSHPEQHDIKEPLSAFNSRVKQEQLEELFKREGNHTFFLPVAAGQGHSFNRHQGVDKWVIRGHVIPRNVLFTRLATLDKYQSEAYGDDIQVELSIINQSNAIGNSYT
ncbi:Fasciclin-1, partial [Stegodyphus mimosarum]